MLDATERWVERLVEDRQAQYAQRRRDMLTAMLRATEEVRSSQATGGTILMIVAAGSVAVAVFNNVPAETDIFVWTAFVAFLIGLGYGWATTNTTQLLRLLERRAEDCGYFVEWMPSDSFGPRTALVSEGRPDARGRSGAEPNAA